MTYRHGLGDAAHSEKVKLSTTSATAIYTVPSETGSVAKLDSLWVCNTGDAVDLTVQLYDASTTTAYTLINRVTGGWQMGAYAEERFDLGGMTLEASDELRLTAGTANRIEAVLTLNESRRQMA